MHKVLQKIDAYYTARLAEHGATPRGVDWNSTESQHLRFEQFLRAIPPSGPVSVLDYGCGYGAFYEFVTKLNPQVRYVGFDVAAAMIETAQSRYPDARFTADFSSLQPADVVIASGIFNVKMDVSVHEWESYVFETLERMSALAKSAMAFNMLTMYSDADRMRADLYYADPHRMFDWCRTRYGRWIATLHDYGLYEFTTIARKLSAGTA
ncbi:MAG TPA: methyltransferase [Candidatus Baltobacteraceae bacterium]|nr:methyltransferase [Candidatus Baltobacteraceae bacterium]